MGTNKAEPLTGDEVMRICNAEEILNFEDFARVRNNFYLYFARNFTGDIYRKQEAYTKCLKAHPEFCKLARYLRARSDRFSNDYTSELYKAYKMMRPYAESNWEMFK